MDVVTLALAKKYTDEHGGGGTTVIANPTLVGTEPNLTGLQVGSNKYKVPTGGAAEPQYIELSFYQDGDTGTLTDAQAQILIASELNYIWLNGMHRLDFRYRDNNNNKATYSAVDTSSDGSKTHSIEINLSTKAFKVYHRTLQEKLTAGNNITISGNTISATDTTYTAGTNITISNNVISAADTTYTAGTAIDISNNKISAKYDDNTIKVNADGKLYATAGGQVIDCNSVGMIIPFAGSGTIPSGYLYCDGAAVSRTTYSELFTVIGTTYGPGDGSTTFNLPDLREKFVEGSSASKAVGTSISAGLPNITASVAVRDTDKNDRSLPIIEGATGSFNITTDGGQHATLKYNGDTNYEHKVLNLDASTSSSVYGNSTTVQPNAVVAKYIIKYTNTLGTLTTVIANPTLAGGEGNLDSIQIGETKFNSSRIKPFPSEFVTRKTLKEFGQSVVSYSQFKMGSTWYGGIECSDLPGDMMQVECKVTAIRDTTITPYENIAIIEIFSSEVAPFYWTYNTNSWKKGTGLDDWKYVVEIDESKLNSITAAYNEELDVKVKKVHAAAGSTGWEFYVDKPADISGKVDKPNEPVVGQGVNVPYYFDVNYSADKATVKDYTIDLLDKSKAPQQFSIDINSATQTTAGLMSAADKKNVDKMLPAYPTDTESEYVLALKYVDGAWVKYWKETINKSDVVDSGMVDYMVIKQ